MMHDTKRSAKMKRTVTRIMDAFNAPESTTKKDWGVIESQMETALPSDYKELIDRMGGGYMEEYMHILEPDCRYEAYDLVEFTDYTIEINEKMWKTEGKPPELQIEGSILIPWATTDAADNLYWRCLPGQHPDKWTVMVNQSRDWEHHEMSCTEFLYAALKKELKSENLDHVFSFARHVFKSYNPVASQFVRHRHAGSRKPKRKLKDRVVRNGVPRTRPRPRPRR